MAIRPLPPKCNTQWFSSEKPPCNPNANQGCADCKIAVPDARRCIAICLSSQTRCNRARTSLYHCFEHSCDLQYLTRNLKRDKQSFVYFFGEKWTNEFKEGRLSREDIELGVRKKLKRGDFGSALKVIDNLIAYRTEIARDFYPRDTTGLSTAMTRTIEKKDNSHRAVIYWLEEAKEAITELWQEGPPAKKAEKKNVTGMFSLLEMDEEDEENEEDNEEDNEKEEENQEDQKQGPVPGARHKDPKSRKKGAKPRKKGPKSKKYEQQIARYLSKILSLGPY